MNGSLLRVIAGGLVCLAASAVPARAEWIASPFAGVTFKGDAPKAKAVVGGSFGWMGEKMVGFDVDFGYTTDIYKENALAVDFYDKSHLTTTMVNAVVAVPISKESRLHPYGTIGFGAIQQKAEDPAGLLSIDHTDLGMDVGGGAWWTVNPMVAIRGDVRYFRALQNGPDGSLRIEDGKFDTWRVVGGAAFTF